MLGLTAFITQSALQIKFPGIESTLFINTIDEIFWAFIAGGDMCNMHCEVRWGDSAKHLFFENKKAQPISVVFGGRFEGSQKDFLFEQLF